MPAPELIVLLVLVAVTVPPPVALNAVVPLLLVLRVSALVKLIVAPVLVARLMPSLVPVEEPVPSEETVPPPLFWTLITCAGCAVARPGARTSVTARRSPCSPPNRKVAGTSGHT